MATQFRFTSGPVTVTLDDGLAKAAEHALRAVRGPTVAAIERETEQVFEGAKADWPVRTGRSRDALERSMTVDLKAGLIKGTIRNGATNKGAPYAYYIKAMIRGRFVHASTVLVRKPLFAARQRLIAELGPEIRAAWERG